MFVTILELCSFHTSVSSSPELLCQARETVQVFLLAFSPFSAVNVRPCQSSKGLFFCDNYKQRLQVQPSGFIMSWKVLQNCGSQESSKQWAHPRWTDLLTESRERGANGEQYLRSSTECAAKTEPEMGQEKWGSCHSGRIAWNDSPWDRRWDWMG